MLKEILFAASLAIDLFPRFFQIFCCVASASSSKGCTLQFSSHIPTISRDTCRENILRDLALGILTRQNNPDFKRTEQVN